MSINRSSLGARSVTENTDATVEILVTRPPNSDIVLETPLPPGKLHAYYNAADDYMTLYVIAPSGLRYIQL